MEIQQARMGAISLGMTTICHQIGTNLIIYLAGRQEISSELYEASKIEGANPPQRFGISASPALS